MTLPSAIAPTQGTNASSYEWILDLAAMPVAPETEPDYIAYPDIKDVQPNASDKTADGTTYANKGQDDVSVIGETFTLALNAKLLKNSAGEIHPAMKLLLDAANSKLPGGDPSKKVIMCRYYHYWVEELAYEFSAEVSWSRANTGVADVEFLNVTLTSKGDRKLIDNPALGEA